MNSKKFKKLFNDFIKISNKKISLVRSIMIPKIQKGVQVVINEVHASFMKAKVMVYRMQPVVVSYSMNAIKQIQSITDVASSKIHFNFQHFVMTSGMAVLVFALTFTLTGMNRSRVEAAEIVSEEEVMVETYNQRSAVNVDYGDEDALVAEAREILGDKVSYAEVAQAITLNDGTPAYELGDYIVKIDVADEDATITVQAKEEGTNILLGSDTEEEQTYKVKVNYVDKQAPVLTLNREDITIQDTDAFDADDYISSITDNHDTLLGYVTEGEVKRLDEKYLEPGQYTIVYRATDSYGNTGEASLLVRVNETKREEEKEATKAGASKETTQVASKATNSAAAQATPSSNESGSLIAQAALAQLGIIQDCTMLVTNALKAAGISFHSAPRGYFSLGTVVSASEAQPGDIIYYDNAGAGVPHVAIYIGNGQAVHGGWKGNTTVINGANIGSGVTYIRVR